MLMENDAFLTELTKLFERTRERGTVTCVMKIVKEGQNKPTPKGEKRPEPTLEEVRAPGSGYGVLVRATDGKRKVSTFVKPEKAAKFSKSYKTIQLAYVELGRGEQGDEKEEETARKEDVRGEEGGDDVDDEGGEEDDAGGERGRRGSRGGEDVPSQDRGEEQEEGQEIVSTRTLDESDSLVVAGC